MLSGNQSICLAGHQRVLSSYRDKLRCSSDTFGLSTTDDLRPNMHLCLVTRPGRTNACIHDISTWSPYLKLSFIEGWPYLGGGGGGGGGVLGHNKVSLIERVSLQQETCSGCTK